MRKLFFLIAVLCITTSYSQAYLGTITKQVNFREGPGTDYPVIKALKPGTQIFIGSLDTDDDFYNIIDIMTDTEGFVHKSFVKVSQEISKSEGGVFTPEGETVTYNPEITVHNDTSKKLTLKLNSQTFYFSPQESKVITLEPGQCDFRASAPGVLPNIGTEHLEGNRSYSWKFYISTYRK